MSDTKVIQQQKMNGQALDLAQLKTVKWISSNYFFDQSLKTSSEQYRRMKGVTILAWMFAPIEFMIISFYLFIHQLPWPQFMVEIIHKIDLLIEDILEFIGNKVEWWFDILAVRLMRLRDSLETLVDTILSLALFISYQVFDLWRWTVRITVGFMMWLFFPLIWIGNQILPHEKIRRVSSLQTDHHNGVTPERRISSSPALAVRNQSFTDDIKSNSSGCDSDISVVSESWSFSHPNRSGKHCNRVAIEATVEGKLRSAMYKRVKTQIALMRKNSITFSRGMTSYAKNVFEPTIKPRLSSLLARIMEKLEQNIFYTKIEKFISPIFSHPIVEWLLNFPNTVLDVTFGKKRKSRRTRSMRSESVRRVNLVANGGLPNAASGLCLSAEPVEDLDNKQSCTIEHFDKAPLKDDSDTSARDSALASSLEDSSPNSDSPECSPMLIIEEQTIREEVSEPEEQTVKQKNKKIPTRKNKLTTPETCPANLKSNLTKDNTRHKGNEHSKRINFSL